MDKTPEEIEKMMQLAEKIKDKLIKAIDIILKIGEQYPSVLRKCASDEELKDLVNGDE